MAQDKPDQKLKTLADARQAATAELVDLNSVDVTASDYQLEPDQLAKLHADLTHLDPLAIARCFPRDEKGRLPLKTRVCLASYESPAVDKHRELWLVAWSPERRRDEQVIRIDLESIIAENQRHRWDTDRWRWDERAIAELAAPFTAGELPELWDLLAPGQTQLAKLAKRSTKKLSPAELQAVCVHWQDNGQAVEALQAYGIQLSEDVQQFYDKPEPAVEPQSNHFLEHARYADELLTGRWHESLHEMLKEVAPWKLPDIVSDLPTKGAKARRGARLHLFPGQTSQSKTGIYLHRSSQLQTVTIMGNDFLPLVRWQRPIELDLWRHLGYREDWTLDPEQKGFIAHLSNKPGRDNLLVYADWLEEQGSPRSSLVRRIAAAGK